MYAYHKYNYCLQIAINTNEKLTGKYKKFMEWN